ncbi:hypothetical protein [Domibacillus indicus]|nr:hypothetical protein [Domibacillus indicus]
MSQEQQALLEAMQEMHAHGEQRDTNLEALMMLIAEKLAAVMKLT